MRVQKQFVMYKNMDVQRKVFPHKGPQCIVLENIYKNKTKKGKSGGAKGIHDGL